MRIRIQERGGKWQFLSGGPGIIWEKRLTGDAVWTGAEPEKYALLTIIVSRMLPPCK